MTREVTFRSIVESSGRTMGLPHRYALRSRLEDVTRDTPLEDVYELYSRATEEKRRATETKALATRVLGRWLHDNGERISTGNGRELAGLPSVNVKVTDARGLGKRCVFELLTQQLPTEDGGFLSRLGMIAGLISELYGANAPGITAARDMLGKRTVEAWFEEHRERVPELDEDGHPVYVATSVKERKRKPKA